MQRKTVLIVDDSPTVRILAQAFLGGLAPHWELLLAEDGPSAMAVVGSHRIDAALLDMSMPGINGLQLGEQLSVLFPAAKISMLTSETDAAVRQQAAMLRFAFMNKPLTEEKARSFIRLVDGEVGKAA